MSVARRLSAEGRTIRERLTTDASGYLHNVVRQPRVTCAICATPVRPVYRLCLRCQRDRDEFGDELADLVVPLCYGIRAASPGT
jgi:hypothetical protein